MIVIVVYGKAQYGTTDYGKGSYFEIEPEPNRPVRMLFIKKAAVFLLEKHRFE